MPLHAEQDANSMGYGIMKDFNVSIPSCTGKLGRWEELAEVLTHEVFGWCVPCARPPFGCQHVQDWLWRQIVVSHWRDEVWRFLVVWWWLCLATRWRSSPNAAPHAAWGSQFSLEQSGDSTTICHFPLCEAWNNTICTYIEKKLGLWIGRTAIQRVHSLFSGLDWNWLM